MANYKKPKCPNCYRTVIQLYIRPDSNETPIGYFCPECKSYYIFEEFKKFGKPLFIGLKEVK